jgi:hypothetical protein
LIDNKGTEGLKKTNKMIHNLNNNTIRYEFIEPLIVISMYSSVLDIEINSIIYTLKLPIGAVYDMLKFSNDIQSIIDAQGYPLCFITVRIDAIKKQVYFTSNEDTLPFRLLFGTGMCICICMYVRM